MPTKTLFWISFFLLLFCPGLPLLFFASYLVACSYRYQLVPTLWRALLVSLLVNLFSSSEAFGLLPLSTCLAVLLLSMHLRSFFADKWTTLPLMTYLFSLYVSLFTFLLMPFFGAPFSLSLRVLVTEILIAPLFDTLLAGIVVLFIKRQKKVAI